MALLQARFFNSPPIPKKVSLLASTIPSISDRLKSIQSRFRLEKQGDIGHGSAHDGRDSSVVGVAGGFASGGGVFQSDVPDTSPRLYCGFRLLSLLSNGFSTYSWALRACPC